MESKAVVFTHVNPRDEDLRSRDTESAFVRKQAARFTAYLDCPNVGLVYVYVSSGIEMLVESMAAGTPMTVALMAKSEQCTTLVRRALDVAVGRERVTSPRFLFLDLPKVSPLLQLLQEISPNLIRNLAGWKPHLTSAGVEVPQFSYDSPKFFEAVIRVVRGVDCTLARHPVVRIDADVLVNKEAIQLILDEYERATSDHDRFFFYSGCYRGPASRSGSKDDLNSHAVRTTGFFDNLARSANKILPTSLTDVNRRFLGDLAEIGAQQVSDGNRSAQVISGAGLVMSLRAILLLPPFMNAGCGIVWIDDHLKRQLHEVIGDLPSTSLERLDEATFVQDRHGSQGITPRQRDFANGEYLERLIRGCMMDAIVRGDRNQSGPGPLSEVIEKSIRKGRASLSVQAKASLKKKMENEARKRGEAAAKLWKTNNYSDPPIRRWPDPSKISSMNLTSLVDSTVTAGLNYVDLFFSWRSYVDAFLRLKRADSNWLFTDV